MPCTLTVIERFLRRPPWLSDTEQAAWRGWIDASRRVLAATDRQLKDDAGLTTDDYEVFVRSERGRWDNRLRMSDLASSVTNSPSRLSQRIDRLTRAGLFVERVRCEEDARVWWVELTDAGRAKLEATAPGHVEPRCVEAFVDRFSAPRRSRCSPNVLPRLADSLEARLTVFRTQRAPVRRRRSGGRSGTRDR